MKPIETLHQSQLSSPQDHRADLQQVLNNAWALIEKGVPVIILAPFDKYFDKTMSNLQEIKARGGDVILITDNKGYKKSHNLSKKIICLPASNLLTAPILYALPLQLIAYYTATLLGTDVDQPRNLAKSVTVE